MPKAESKISKKRIRSSYITSVISISLVLFLLGLVGLLVLNAKSLSDYVKENIGFSVILKENIREVDMIKLQKNLDAKKYVKSTNHITREEAAAELQKALGEDFIEFLGYNPLLSSIEVKLYAQYANPDSILLIKQDVEKYDMVKEVFYQESLVHIVNENVRKISVIILVISALLFFIAFALINNTIRLSIYAKRFIINTMQLVGATRSFIQKPFIIKGAIHGIYGALISILFLSGFLYFIQRQLEEFIVFKDTQMIVILFVVVILLGIIVNTIATYFSVNKYLRIKHDDLYY